ncbi:homoserine dehydrogenase [Microvirga sp. STR05]|uniref:Homoserine dehydrogenase n=1 Tax=Hymenobacter duratus TaxID=2771356 RepID=A0ABR8JHP0_9BACT|nr:homoserine dehydrogenase [Hymenobacter duratus]MBD2715128.1 homoserine dehydrogenase [Hymenobacter duratus]MBR7950034.1 homoserine dehydrogenase [Microvirga sp. STR05]
MLRKDINIGLFGFGVVGQGLHTVLERTPGLRARIGRIGVKDRAKPRTLPLGLFTFSRHDLLDDPALDVIVELIDDADEAYLIVTEALRRGKAVVTANKKMLSEHLGELIELQRETGTPLLYEAAACASLPVIRNLEEYYDTDLLESVEGIINGSTNYILTAMHRDALSFGQALSQAQALGFAESNPALDVEGLDARNKLVLLLAHAFGLVVAPEQLLTLGIDRLSPLATAYAKEQGYALKLVAEARRLPNGTIAAAVLPTLVKPEHELAHVHDEYNGLITQSSFADRQFFLGRGAGAFPTASAVLSDLSALTYGYRYEYKKLRQQTHLALGAAAAEVEVLVTFTAETAPDPTDFRRVHEQFQSDARGHYLTGTIGLEQLAQARWLREPGICVVRLPGTLRAAQAVEAAAGAIGNMQ